LFYKPGIPIAIIEAKDNNHTISDGMQQGLWYAEMLDVPLYLVLMVSFHSITILRKRKLENMKRNGWFPPEKIMRMWCEHRNITPLKELTLQKIIIVMVVQTQDITNY
jgi:type I restriction enzyme R subunit